MPLYLHAQLKRGLDFDEFYVDPEDLIEDPPAEYEDAEHRAAKRRRIEAIASRYLRGRPPVILTAGLRGPFNNGWKNPWAKPIVEKERTSGKGKGNDANSNKVAAGQKDTVGHGSSARLRKSTESVVVEESAPPQIKSPETSRAARDDFNHREHDDSLDEIEVPPATAPLPDDEDNVSSTIESVSVTTARCIQNRSPMTNPFWLRRPDSARVDMRKATNRNTDTSPTRSRSRNSASQTQTQTLAELRLSLPKAPFQARTSAPELLEQEECRSSASASMMISSPARGVDVDVHAQAQATANPVTDASDTPAQTIATPLSSQPAQRSQRTVPIITSSMGSQGRRTRDDVQQSAERPVDPASASKPREPLRRTSRQSTQNAPTSRPVSRKTKQKPRAVNFDSSPDKVPSVKKPVPGKTAAHNEADNELQEDSTAAVTVDVPASPQVEEDATIVQGENADFGTSRGSRDSDWSTQAAMLRAQLEFQQSTFPMVSPEVLWFDSQTSLQDTPRPILAAPMAAITPLSTFTVQRDEPLAPETVLQAPSISTQDLFGAASPFAFSTVKKKSEETQRSNLRFAFSPGDGVLKADAVAKSPTPTADRIPLKDKNNMTSFWSFTTDKASQGSQGLLSDRSKRALNDS
ncbi:hypothetical protein G6011_09769 [Alternaria panax]|uniref:Uncharacterized protein n=1 Tax=Alternaria panax TaxID=48097 RepID=A0AAD4FCM0_9PLEO|nr:hypothetical protein G6011_09769 [Alternaria panax]